MKTLSFALVAASGLILCACASGPSAYGPASRPGAPGYAVQPIEQDRYRVTYSVPDGASAAVAADFALLRAAELTLEQGREWFVVDTRTLGRAPEPGGPRISVGVGGATGSRGSGVGVGLGVGFGGGARVDEAPIAILEIRTGAGPRPEGANVYDARAVAQTIGPRAGRA